METWTRGTAIVEPFTIELTIEDVLADLDPGFLPVVVDEDAADAETWR